MPPLSQTVRRVALASFACWLVPLLASRLVDGWNWPPGAFVITYLLFFSTGMAYALIARQNPSRAYKFAVGLSLAAGFVLAWATLVHLSETENRLNLVYFGVLAIAAAGAALARLQPQGMARALFATALSLAASWYLTQVLNTDSPAGPVWNLGVIHGGFVLLFTLAGLLFRQAALVPTKSTAPPPSLP